MSWIIKKPQGGYLFAYGKDFDEPVFIEDRNEAEKFETREQAKKIKEQYSITGSIIPG